MAFSPSDIRVSCISNILVTVVLSTTQPNGKFSEKFNFSWLVLSEGIEHLEWIRVYTKVGSLLSGYL